MSLLAQQLSQLQIQGAIKIAPGAPKPTLILDQNTARSTTIGVLFTMAMMGYAEMKRELPAGANALGELLLSEGYKEFNRNKLTPTENKDLSAKLTRFLLLISPWFLNRGCQAVLEYLLRNFSIHVFESEQLVLIFLQYWQHEAYARLIKNVEVHKPHLSFVKQLQEGKQVNLTFIVRSLTYSRSLLETLIMFTRRFIREESEESEDVEIDILATRPTNLFPTKISNLVKHDPKQFLLQILSQLLIRKINTFNKQICELCVFTSKEDNAEVRSMSMMLTISMLSSEPTHHLWVEKVMQNLLRTEEVDSNLFTFVMVIWQRWPKLLSQKCIEQVIVKQGFVGQVKKFGKSLYMPFYTLFSCYFDEEFPHRGILGQLLEICVLRVKDEPFVAAHQNAYFSQLLTLFHHKVAQLGKQEASFMKAFVKENLQYEYAIFIDSEGLEPILGVFSKAAFNNSKVDFAHIVEVRQKREEAKIANEPMIQEESADQEQQQPVEEQSSLLKIINSRSKRTYNEIDGANPEIQAIMGALVSEFYSNQGTISVQQKNRLLEFPIIFTQYTPDNFAVDLLSHDYSTAIRFLMKEGTTEMCYSVLIQVMSDQRAAGDMLFRELCRQAIQKLAVFAKQEYKKVINTLGKLYHQFSKNQNPELIKQLNELMLRASEAVIGAGGKAQGKFYKLISCHCKMLAALTLSHAHREDYALSTYVRMLSIFGSANNYIILVGVIEMLALKQKNNKQFGNFVEKVLLPSLSGKEDNFVEYFHFLQSIVKLLLFTYHMLREGREGEFDSDSLIAEMSFGVARKMIVSFFGLITPKSKRNIARKVFMFLSVLFRSPHHAALFQDILSSISRKQELKMASVCSKAYTVFLSISEVSAGPVKQAVSLAKEKLLSLFPLELKIYVLGPLLPLDEVYCELGNQLQAHTNRKFDSLSHFVSIVPNRLTPHWLKFITQAMKRSFLPSTDLVKEALSEEMPSDDNSKLQFIVALTELAKEESLEVLDLMMTIVFKECAEPNDYSLAIIFCLVRNLKEYAEPYLDRLFKIAIEVESSHAEQFLREATSILTAPTLLALAKNWKSVTNFANFTLFLSLISEKVSFESIWKTTQQFFARSITTKVEAEESLAQLSQMEAQVFVKQAMKMNENQLRKVLIDYVRWSSQKTASDSAARLYFNSRKNLLLNIFQAMSSKFSHLFSHFFGYIFQDLAKDLESLVALLGPVPAKSVGKKERGLTEYAQICVLEYTESALRALCSLFQNDPGNEFMDSVKFDLMGPKIGSLFNLTGLGARYSTFISDSLRPCLLSLFKNTSDDYKLKSLNTDILRLLKTKDQNVASSIYVFYDQVIDQLEHRFLLFTDELIPLLVEASHSRSQTVKKAVESIIYKIQNLSGQRLDTLMR